MKEHSQLQATRAIKKSNANCKQRRRSEPGVQDNGVTHTCNDVHQVENETKFLTAESPEESTVSSSTHESTGAAFEQGCKLDVPVVVRRQALKARTVLGIQAAAVHRQDHRDPWPDTEADPSSSDRAANDPLVTQRPVPTIHRISKTLLRYRKHSSWRRTHDTETVPLIQKIQKTVEIHDSRS